MAESRVILLADDNPDDVFLIKRALRQGGFRDHLVVARDGEEVLQYLKGEGPFANRAAHPLPGLVLLDLDMPRVNGFQVLEWIRGQPPLRALPVIVLTTSAYSPDVRLAYQYGANSFLTKPSDPAELTRALQEALQFWFSQEPLDPGALPPTGETPDPPGPPKRK
jgi:CheY-like chemotaxis protein